VENGKLKVKIGIPALVVLASLAVPSIGAAKPLQVIPEPMLVNLFALTEASATLQICAQSNTHAALAKDKKKLLLRLQKRIDRMVKSMAAKFDNDLFGFFEGQRNKAARNPLLIEQVRSTYGLCGDALFKRMQWYVYDSRQKLELFLSELPDVR
jgi:hypothetical protein